MFNDPKGLYGTKKEAKKQRRKAKKAGYDVGDIQEVNGEFYFGTVNGDDYAQTFEKTSWGKIKSAEHVRKNGPSEEYLYENEYKLGELEGYASNNYAEIEGKADVGSFRAYNGSGVGSSGMPFGVDLGISASVVEAEVKFTFGTDVNNANIKISGKAVSANANARGGFFTG